MCPGLVITFLTFNKPFLTSVKILKLILIRTQPRRYLRLPMILIG